MSHLKERSEKNCLNCNAVVHGKYCHVCGQENLHPQETAWHLVTHFFNDITHFDGKFFSTLKYLVFKPGFLSSEYKAGRRASYLNPVRLYLLTSAIFFLVFFSTTHIGDNVIQRDYGKGKNRTSLSQIEKMDSLQFDHFTRTLKNGLPMTRSQFTSFRDSVDKIEGGVHLSTNRFKNKATYDSLLRAGRKDGWITRQLEYKEIELQEKYHGDQVLLIKALINYVFHSFPQMLFISLPLFALMLRLLYYRRKHFYYVSQAIFSIHYYVFVFLMMLLVIFLRQINNFYDGVFIKFLLGVIFMLVFFYLYKAMRNFYQQGRGKTIFKFILLNIMMLVIISILLTLFIFFSFLKI